MYVNTCQSRPSPPAQEIAHHQRVDSAAAVSFKPGNSKTKLDRLYQQGSAKIRFPKHYGEQAEAVMINTAGGLTGGDRIGWDLSLGKHCNVVVTTQACEKSYKSASGEAQIQTSIKLETDSTLHWLPQETILYDGSSLRRNLTADMEANAEFLAIESIVLGRQAMGETISKVQFHDRWRIRKSGKMCFADDLRLSGLENTLTGFGENRALCSLLYVSSQDQEMSQALVAQMRQACSAHFAGLSTFGGKITGRILAPDSYQLRNMLSSVLKILRGSELPSLWRI